MATMSEEERRAKKNTLAGQTAATASEAAYQIPDSAPPGWSPSGGGGPVEGNDFTRNVNNSLNALGGMGVVASVPLKGAAVARGAMNAPPVLPSAIQRIGMAKPAADWVAGMGPASQVSQAANTIPQAVGTAPRVIAGLQEGAQANAISAGTRALGGASAGLTGADAQKAQPVGAIQQPNQAKPLGAEEGFMPGTRAVMSGFADDAKTMMQQGLYGALAGQLGRATAAMPLAIAEDMLRPAVNLGTPLFQGAANAIKTFATGDSSPASLQVAPPSAAAATPAGATPAPINSGRSSAAFSATDPRRVDLGPSSAAGVLGQVARTGNSYSGTNVAGDIAVNGKPAGGTVTMLGGNPGDLTSAERMAMDQRAHDINLQSIGLRQQLADAQAGYTPGVNIVGSDRSYGNMRERTPEQAARDAAVSASSITANAGLSARQMRQFAGQDRRNAIDQQQVDATLRGQDMSQSLGLLNAGQRSEAERRAADIERAKLGILGRRTDAEVAGMGADARVKGVQANAAEQLAGLRQRFMAATKPEEQASLARQIDTLSGREKQSLRDNFMTVGGGQEWDAAAGTMRNVPQRLVDLRTGQEAAAPQAPAVAKMPAVGEVRGGYKFKGGDPNDKTNWTK